MGNSNRDRGAGNRFGKHGGGGFSGGYRGGGGRGHGSRGERPQMHKAVCNDCDRDCQVPFRPTGDRPVLCSDCFDQAKSGGGGNDRRDNRRSFRNETPAPAANEDAMKKVEETIAKLDSKLDKIINILQRVNPVKEITVMKAEEVKEEVAAIPRKDADKKVATKKVAAKKKSAAKKKVTPKKKTVAKEAPAAKKRAAGKKK